MSNITVMANFPIVIQGGMGVGVSGWRLANAVSSCGQLGVVSGTALDAVMVRRLQLGDVGGHVRRALASFPLPEAAERILEKYFVAGGKDGDKPYRGKPMATVNRVKSALELVTAANFVEVFLAKEGHDKPVGINYLEKIQVETLGSIYGAMLAGVDYVLMGAGIPKAIPAVLSRFAEGEASDLALDVKGATKKHFTRFDPRSFFEGHPPRLPRPRFLAIVASHVLATMLSRAEVPPDGFVIEGPTAGGHNAPPRQKEKTETGEPLYGPRDVPDLTVFSSLGLPYWLAGGQATPDAVKAALGAGAVGVQVGTAFAFCEESDLRPDLKQSVLEGSARGEVKVFTDPDASPTGFPFKIIQLPKTLSDRDVYEQRERICDLGYLRTPFENDEGKVKWRCPAEPVVAFVDKGGTKEETENRQCLCNALMANIGLGQMVGQNEIQQPLLTAGDDAAEVARFLAPGKQSYSAAEVVSSLLSRVAPQSSLATD